MAGVHKYKDGVVSKNCKGLQGLIKSRGITVRRGRGPARRRRRPCEVDGDTYTGTNLVLATGSYSRTLPGLDLDGERVIASEHALQLDRVPATAIVLGGGVIGVEFACAWTSFGAEVTDRRGAAAPGPARGRGQLQAARARLPPPRHRLQARRPVRERRAHRRPASRVTLEGGETLEAELLLVAVGRGPASAGLGYEEQGVAHRARLRRHRRATAAPPSTASTRSAT